MLSICSRARLLSRVSCVQVRRAFALSSPCAPACHYTLVSPCACPQAWGRETCISMRCVLRRGVPRGAGRIFARARVCVVASCVALDAVRQAVSRACMPIGVCRSLVSPKLSWSVCVRVRQCPMSCGEAGGLARVYVYRCVSFSCLA